MQLDDKVGIRVNMRNALAASRSRPAEAKAGMVKALKWDDHSYKDDLLLIAYHPFGDYNIKREPDLVEWPFVLRPFIAGQSNFQTIDAAKTAAQADYEARILSALEPVAEAKADLLPIADKTGKEPCGECHLQPGETCDICHATEPVAEAKAEPVAIPDEWVLVPREPTEAMLQELRNVVRITPETYARILAASPTSPALTDRVPDWVAEFLNRRTEVERVLRFAAVGKRPPLTLDECKDLANKLAVPDEVNPRAELVATGEEMISVPLESLRQVHTVLHFDLRRFRNFNHDDFNQAVVDAGDRVTKMLESAERAPAEADEIGECRYCGNSGWFYGDKDLNTYCGCAFGKLRESLSPSQDAIKAMVDRFLQWKLPDDFNPDGGISFHMFYAGFNGETITRVPVGTNLFTATQAEAMIRHILGI